jgi:hypothetical protein
MTALVDLSDYVNRATGGNSGTPENTFWHKRPYITTVQATFTSGYLYSMWKWEGFPGPGATPTSAAVPTNATAGAMPFTDPGGGRQKWLMGLLVGVRGSAAYLFVYDRLLHNGGLSGTVTTAQTVGGTLTRHTGGVGNQIWIENYNAAVGSTPQTITASYTNQAGTSGRTTQAVTFGGGSSSGYNDASMMIQLPLQAGDTGVRAVASVTISGSTGNAGNFGVTILSPIAWVSVTDSGGVAKSFAAGSTGLPAIEAGACIATAMYVVGTSEHPIWGAFGFVEA